MQISKILFSIVAIALHFSFGVNTYFYMTTLKEKPSTSSSIPPSDDVTKRIFSLLNLKLIQSTSTADGNTFSIICNSFTATSTDVLPPCFASYYNKDFTNTRTVAIPMSNDVDVWEFKIIDKGPSFIRFSLGQFMYGFGDNTQFIFETKGSGFFGALRELVPCVGPCKQLNDNLFAVTIADNSGIDFVLLSSSTDFYPNQNYAKYKISENDLEEGYGIIFKANGDPCRSCGKPSVTLLENNKAEITLTKKVEKRTENSETEYDYKTVTVDLKHD